MGHRYNERNIGNYTLEGEPKRRRTSKPRINQEEVALLKAVLERLLESLELDPILSKQKGKAMFTDGGRFIISLTRDQVNDLSNIIRNRKM